MFKLRAITATGADDSVDPKQLIDLAMKYPLAEFGILFWNHMGTCRFPSDSWMIELRRVMASCRYRPRLSCHLCGGWAEEFLVGPSPSVPYLDLWDRIQINTHGKPHPYVPLRLVATILSLQRKGRDIEVIFQRDESNNPIFDYLHGQRHIGALPAPMSTLFDLSHGAGVLPDDWPCPIFGASCGYAGGLSPDNVATQLDRIAAVVSGSTTYTESSVWIDAETRLRSEDLTKFDLSKVEEFLARATLWEVRRSGG